MMEEDRNDVLRWVDDALDESEHAALGAEAVFAALTPEHDHDPEALTEAAAYTRRNVWDAPAALYHSLRRALDSINTAANPAWGRFWFLHRVLGATVHSFGAYAPRFLPWHRLMLWKFEQLLRSTSEGGSVYLPYWTWWHEQGSGSPPARKGVPAFWVDYRPAIQVPTLNDPGLRSLIVALLGSSARRAIGNLSQSAMISRILGALMRDGRSLLGRTIAVTRADRAALRRGSRTTSGRFGDEDLPSRADVRGALRETSFDAFSQALEGVHASPHVWVGNVDSSDNAMRNPEWSPCDILFYFHHAECDRLWRLWQQRRGVGTPPTVTGAELPPWTERMSDVMDIVNGPLGFAYENASVDDPMSSP
jgi:hypothetical protein